MAPEPWINNKNWNAECRRNSKRWQQRYIIEIVSKPTAVRSDCTIWLIESLTSHVHVSTICKKVIKGRNHLHRINIYILMFYSRISVEPSIGQYFYTTGESPSTLRWTIAQLMQLNQRRLKRFKRFPMHSTCCLEVNPTFPTCTLVEITTDLTKKHPQSK